MPIYEYVCNGCGHEFEEWQRITDAPVRTCPACGERKVERLVSLSAFHLKGSGWYVTDYGGKKPGCSERSSTADKAAKSSEGAKGEQADKGKAEPSKAADSSK